MYFVFVKVVAQVAGFVGIVVAGGIGMDAGDGFGGTRAYCSVGGITAVDAGADGAQ
ncbi:hypothetical protein [Snodgrassella communis]|uniref:hypothetical protein n=1 Tax=Snodgrassella communis TaxID=2946699 RepID=UPI0015D54F47|nr:hypothetical protein [Snodgrassella communis]